MNVCISFTIINILKMYIRLYGLAKFFFRVYFSKSGEVQDLLYHILLKTLARSTFYQFKIIY